MGETYKQWVNESRTVLVTLWRMNDGSDFMTVATREHPADVWGPPVTVEPEKH